MKTHLLQFFLMAALWPIHVTAEEEAAETLARERAAAYLAAWKERDAAALAALYASDAEFTTAEGERLQGREAILERTKAFVAANPGAELSLQVDGARLLTPEVLVEEGRATVTLEGVSETSGYRTTHVKKEGSWRIAEIYETGAMASEVAATALGELEWMIGTWKVAEGSSEAESEAMWTLDGRFITRTTRIPEPEGGDFVSVEVIGYDPNRRQIRSWIFDNEGGFGEGYWSADGNQWLVGIRAAGPSGAVSSADHVITLDLPDKLTLESMNRMIDGQALPNRPPLVLVRSTDESENPSE